MKKVFGLLMVAALIVSCSDDDKKPSVDMSKLTAGKWYQSSSKTTVAGNSESENYEHACASSKDYIQFANGIVTRVEYGSDCVAYSGTDAYTLSGTSITSDGETVVVKELSSSKLVIESSETYEGVKFVYEDVFTAN
jgi:hypothetical protein